MIKTILAIFLMSFCVERYINYRRVYDLDIPDIMYHHYPGPCSYVTGPEGGSEDITLLPNDLLLASSGLLPMHTGRILLLDLKESTYKLTDLKITGESFNHSTFKPHGLSHWVSNNGDVTVMVVNHAPDGECVEVFKLFEKSRSLKHVKTITSPLFTSLNDLVMTSDKAFYVSKMTYNNYKNFNLMILELMNSLHSGGILFHDGTSTRSVADGLFSPNGLNVSPDMKFLYVAEFGAKKLKAYTVLPSMDLKLIQDIAVNSAVDNIEIDKATGNLWIGSHPMLHKIMKYIRGEITTTPSQVIKAKVKDGRIDDLVEVFLDPGHVLPASSTATVYNKTLIIGSVGSTPIICDLLCVE